MSEAGGERAHQRQPVGSFQIFFQNLSVFIVAQQHDGAEKLSMTVLQRRSRDANRRLVSPAGDEVALTAGAFLTRRPGFLDQVEQPWLPFEYLFQRMADGGGGRSFSEHFRGFIEKADSTVKSDGDHAIVEIAKDLLPRDLRRGPAAFLTCDFHIDSNGLKP